MTRVLIVGKNGQIGWELFKNLQSIADVTATERSDLDVRNRRKIFQVFETVKPDVVINATGYNDVDGAEVSKGNAFSVNVAANEFMAAAACKIKALYLTYSTDYVFDGQKKLPYVEGDLVNPLNVYGQTKLDGETAIISSGVNFLILRTSSVFSLRRPCFLTSFLKRTQQVAQVQVRSDLVSSPTSARYLADVTKQIVSIGKNRSFEWLSERKGVYHLAGAGAASRFEWAREICDILKFNVELLPSTYSVYPLVAERPMYSALDSSRFLDTFGLKSIPWEKMLEDILKDFYEEK